MIFKSCTTYIKKFSSIFVMTEMFYEFNSYLQEDMWKEESDQNIFQ